MGGTGASEKVRKEKKRTIRSRAEIRFHVGERPPRLTSVKKERLTHQIPSERGGSPHHKKDGRVARRATTLSSSAKILPQEKKGEEPFLRQGKEKGNNFPIRGKSCNPKTPRKKSASRGRKGIQPFQGVFDSKKRGKGGGEGA